MYKILLATFLLVSSCSFAQENFVLRNYTAANGVPQSQINGMLEDDNGYLWLATYGGGLARFDGQGFKVYTTLDGLLNNVVYDLKIDSDQNIWAMHPKGVSRFDGATFKTFHAPAGSDHRPLSIKSGKILNDTIFILVSPGLLGKIYKDSVYYWAKPYQHNAFINRIYQFESGDLCILMSDKRIFIKDSAGDDLIGRLPENQVVYSAYRENGNVRLQSYSQIDRTMMVHEINPESKTVRSTVKNEDGMVLYSNPGRSELWMMEQNNLVRVNTHSGNREIILKDRAINYIMPDQEGNIWIGSNGSGLYKYYHQDFSRVGPDDLVGVMSVFEDGDVLWAGSMSQGLWRFQDGKQSFYGSREEILSIARSSDGTIWAGGTIGIQRFDPRTNKIDKLTTKVGLAGNYVLSIQFDEQDNAWIATASGLSFYDGKRFTNYTAAEGLLSDRVNAAYYSRKFKTLFAGSELGMSTISQGKVEKIVFSEFANTAILSINPYRDSLLLIGSGGSGFIVFDPVRKTSKLITTHEGLASDFIYFIASDKDDVIWVGTEKGINRIKLDEQLSIVENIHYDHENGLTGVETNQNAVSVRGDRKFFGLIDGLYRFNESDSRQYRSFDVHLTDVEVFYGEESSRSYADRVTGAFRIPDHPVFPYDKNHLTFSFNRVDKLNPKSVKFKYQLMNYDKGWSKPSSGREVTYSNLPPGRYEFVVAATDHFGNWSGNELHYAFTIRAAFYQTAAFWIVVLLLLGGIIALAFYFRMRHKIEQAMVREKIRLQEQETLRKEIARDFHDEMGNQLTRIINYVSLLKMNGTIVGGSSRSDLYTKVENSAKYLYTGTRDFIWSIDPVNDELSKLFIHIRDFGEKLFEEKDIKFRAFNDIKINVKLPYGFSREANLIFKEAMTNTFKYSQARNATLSLISHDHGFEFTFEDDGNGFDVAGKSTSNGLKNIRERAEKLKALLLLTSQPGEGTRVSLKFQFEKRSKYVSSN